ncbi:hypothetical protein C8T65DRAFT_648897 [Cerioporus squamosus]|nr:hypothetical protein C8T65DRAFT_648897 [Cerioporus squamosus]
MHRELQDLDGCPCEALVLRSRHGYALRSSLLPYLGRLMCASLQHIPSSCCSASTCGQIAGEYKYQYLFAIQSSLSRMAPFMKDNRHQPEKALTRLGTVRCRATVLRHHATASVQGRQRSQLLVEAAARAERVKSWIQTLPDARTQRSELPSKAAASAQRVKSWIQSLPNASTEHPPLLLDTDIHSGQHELGDEASVGYDEGEMTDASHRVAQAGKPPGAPTRESTETPGLPPTPQQNPLPPFASGYRAVVEPFHPAPLTPTQEAPQYHGPFPALLARPYANSCLCTRLRPVLDPFDMVLQPDFPSHAVSCVFSQHGDATSLPHAAAYSSQPDVAYAVPPYADDNMLGLQRSTSARREHYEMEVPEVGRPLLLPVGVSDAAELGTDGEAPQEASQAVVVEQW